jgi:LmbE family N-acetylglucosaminyl deacetylase
MLKGFNRVLVVAPHPDDETIGAGGTIHRLASTGTDVVVAVMTGNGQGTHPLFPKDSFATVRKEFEDAMGVLGVKKSIFADLPTTLLTETPVHQINHTAAAIVSDVKPDLILLPFENDLHRDHGLVNYAFSVALRPHLPSRRQAHLILNYEVLSETHLHTPYVRSAFDPQLWIDISISIEAKMEALSCFRSQIAPSPGLRSLQAIRGLATLRGAQIGVDAAEAFVVARCVA